MTLRAHALRHPLVGFVALTLALSWWPWPLFALGLSAAPIASFGPFLAAMIMLMITQGRAGVVGLLRRMGRWRVGARWYVVALGLPLLLGGVAVLINVALGAQVDLTASKVDGWLVLPMFAVLLVVPGLGGAWEEPGWRGYALPRLQSGRTALRAGLMLGVLVAVWHLPLIVTGEVAWTDVIQIMGAVIVFNWVFNNARGSVLIIMIAHASNNTVWSALTSKIVAESDYGRQAALQAVVWCVTAVVVVLVSGPTNLSRRHAKQEEPPAARAATEQRRTAPLH